MKRKRFSVEQIVAVLKQAEIGVPVADNREWGPIKLKLVVFLRERKPGASPLRPR